ncbi:MAG: ABC transporter permease [Candidatus Aenigmarchaeota archaeon]|nr:ABC transporter permease [Candidatus Aenigmarchaeota archaeon]
MKTSKSLRLALNIMLHSKLRSWLTIIGIVIGVAAVVAIMSMGEGMQASLESNLGGLGADIITVSPGASRASGGFIMRGSPGDGRDFFSTSSSSSTERENLTSKDVQIIKSVDNVEYVAGTVSGRAELYYLGEKTSVSVEGVDPLVWNKITTSELESGRFLTTSDYNSVVIGSGIANDIFKQPLVINRIITIEENSFKIVGILAESGSGFGGGGDDRSVIMPIEAARNILDDVGTTEFGSITVKVADENLAEETMAAIDAKLMLSRHVTERTKDYSISSSLSMQETISSTMESVTLFLAAIAGVSLLVGAIGIANTMFTTVLEKTKEIGIMKAIGAKNHDIMMIFMLNSALVGMVGGVIGIILGSVASTMVTLPMMGGRMMVGGSNMVTLQLLVFGLSIAVGIGMISGAIPAYRASKLRPVDALRYE